MAAAVLAAACSPRNSVTVSYDGGKTRVEAVSQQIIRVSSVPEGAEFSSDASLCVLPYKGKVKCSVTSTENEVSLSTGEVVAVVSRADGSVKFTDFEGNVITSEDSRSFSPIEVDGVKGWTVRQTFNSPDDEGFFGLGQHQADEWNYKGRNEELYQYNTKISVPFVVSSRRYGILWDSYCFCRWGDPRPYASLGNVFTLYDKYGVEGALTGTYTPAKGAKLVRRETALEQEFLRVPQCDVVMNSPEGFDFNGSHVEFEGSLQAREDGVHRFYLYYAGYTKVSVGGKEVMPEIWRTAWNPNGRKFEVDMKAGVKTPIRIEWIPDGGVSYDALRVLSPVPAEEQQKMSWWGEMQDQIDYYFIAGKDIDGVIGGYRTLTGKAPIPPKWAMGYWQSFERYHNQKEMLDVSASFRRLHLPIDNIVQDWQYWKDDQWGSHEFDEARYPDPKGMVDTLHSMNLRYMISVWPKFYAGTEHFKEMDDKGWIYREAIDSKVVDWLGYEQSFYDAYDADARKLFWKQMYDHLYPIGVDSWWMDASEPNIHDCTDMDYRKKMCGPTALGPSAKYFNAYALMNAQAIYEGQRSVDDRRVFLLTRNGFAGLQRYSTASWSGDIGTRWEDMKAQLSAGLNYSISGIPMWGQDVGGFSVESRYSAAYDKYLRTGEVNDDLKEWRELNVRWHQWGVFTPLYRSHGQFPNREPWNIAPLDTEEFGYIKTVMNYRYAMMPYIYSLAAKMYFDDYTLMRPLVMDFTDDPVACNISDEYMFGNALLVCPVMNYGQREREVYFPEGSVWYGWDHGTDESVVYEGGSRILAPAPLSGIPMYFRGGEIYVVGNPVQSTAEQQTKLCISVFAGGDASFTLYSDNGLDYSYEKGQFARVPLNWDEASRTLTIGAREGSYKGMPQKYSFECWLTDAEGVHQGETAEYDGSEIVVKF